MLGDCDGDASNGCEAPLDSTEHCGGCDVACGAVNGTASCLAGECAITNCDAGWADCDGDPATSCETSLASVTSCGACDVVCAPAGGTGACIGGACAIGGCEAGYADCDGAYATGCETPLNGNYRLRRLREHVCAGTRKRRVRDWDVRRRFVR